MSAWRTAGKPRRASAPRERRRKFFTSPKNSTPPASPKTGKVTSLLPLGTLPAVPPVAASRMLSKSASACALLFTVALATPALADPPRTKAVYLTTISGGQYLTAEFQRVAGTTISYQVSPDLATWLAPGTGGAPSVVETTSPVDNLATIARLDRPVSAAGKYFLRAVGQNAVRRVPLDFDGDGKTDYVVIREGAGGVATWLISYS